MDDIEDRLAAVRGRMAAAAKRAGREPESVELVAVSKTHPAAAVRACWDAGQAVFGESRVQEALAKAPELPAAVRWHFIGHLQKNKVRKALPLFELIHGVDSLDLALAVDRVAAEEGLFPKVLLEVNVSGEASKRGFAPEQVERDLEALLGLARVEVLGLMTLAPYSEEAEHARPFFVKLRELRDRLAGLGGAPLEVLSMGMSGDYEVAIEEGSTLVRVGTAIFGSRPRPVAE